MLHSGLEKTKGQGYPSVKSILKDTYEDVDGIEDAEITAVDLGARSYGFVVKLPENSSAVEKELFLKIQIPFHSSKSATLEAKEAEIQKKTFEFMEFSHDKFAIPKVLRSKGDDFVPHVTEGAGVPSDLKGYELVLMTKALGQAVPFSEKGEAALQDFITRRPGKNTGNLMRDDANYTGHDISRMASNIADMHKVGAKFLKKNEVPINPSHGIRARNEIYADLEKALGFDVAAISEKEIEPKIAELKKSINEQALISLRKIPGLSKVSGSWSDGVSSYDAVKAAKANFWNRIPQDVRDKYKDLPSFTIGLEEAIRGNGLTPDQIKLGRQIQQVDENLLFSEGDKIATTVKMARDLSEIYKGVEKLPQTVLHNDTNASNFLLDRESGKMTLIDYDTLGRGPRIGDLMTHHAGSEKITKAVISAYDEKIPLTPEEQKFGPYVVACLTFDKFAEALGKFSDTEKMNDQDHLNSLGWGIDMAYNGAKHWNEKEKVDLIKITDEARVEMSTMVQNLRGLDLAVSDSQSAKDYDPNPIKTKGGNVFGEEGLGKTAPALQQTWVKKIELEKTHAEKMTGKTPGGSYEI